MDQLADIAVPSLIIIGEKDDQYLRAADVLEARITNAERVTIPNAGHITNLDDPEAFNRAVVDFLNRLRKG